MRSRRSSRRAARRRARRGTPCACETRSRDPCARRAPRRQQVPGTRALISATSLAIGVAIRVRARGAARLVPDESPVAHDRRVRREREPFGEVVRHEHQCGAARAERSVSASVSAARRLRRAPCMARPGADSGLVHDRARNRDTLLQPSAQRSHRRIRAVVHAHSLEARSAAARGDADAVQSRRELDVLQRRQRRVQHARVRDQPDLGSRRGTFLNVTPSTRAVPSPGAAGRRECEGASSSLPRSARTVRGTRQRARQT